MKNAVKIQFSKTGDPGGNSAEGQFLRSKSVLLAALVLASASGLGWGAEIILTNNSSEVRILNPPPTTGMYFWGIQYTPGMEFNSLTKQWFWYRVGSGRELPLSGLAISELTPTTVKLTYALPPPSFNLSIKFTFAGGAFCTGQADITEEITINNPSPDTLDFHLFQYADFDLDGGLYNQVFLARDDSTLGFNRADQWGGQSHVKAVTTPSANHGEVGIVPSILMKLTNAVPDVLNDSTNASGGNVAWAWQWDLSIGAGGSQVITVHQDLSFAFIASGGAIRWGVSTTGARQAGYFYLFKVALPPGAVASGAAWKLQSAADTEYSTDSTNWFAPTGGAYITSFPLVFRQAAGYGTPPLVVTNLQSSTNFENNVQLTIIPANYVLVPPPQLTDVRRVDNARLAMTLQGITNRVYTLQFCTNLVGWNLVSLLTNTGSGTLTFTNSPPAGSSRGFYRVREGTN